MALAAEMGNPVVVNVITDYYSHTDAYGTSNKKPMYIISDHTCLFCLHPIRLYLLIVHGVASHVKWSVVDVLIPTIHSY